MSKRQLFVLILVASAICLIMGIYYLVPGVWHPLVFDGSATDQHVKHALLCFGLAVIGVVASRFVLNSRPGPAAKK
jgi:hypothetical protein